MRVLTLNTWQKRGPWESRWEIIFSEIARLKPDLIGFQEVFDPVWNKQIAERLGGLEAYFPQEDSGLMIISRFPIVSVGKRIYETQSREEDYSRYAIYVEVSTQTGSCFLFNTHLSWKLHEEATRHGQAQELANWSLEIAKGAACFAVGDFNAPPHEKGIGAMQTEGGFKDSFQELHPGVTGFTWSQSNPYTGEARVRLPDRRLDYVFYRDSDQKQLSLKTVERVMTQPDSAGVYATDHFGVLAEL